MLHRRGDHAGLPGLYPHQRRHTFAHEWLAQGGGETDLMRLAGWKSRAMLQRYGVSPLTPAPARHTADCLPQTGCDGPTSCIPTTMMPPTPESPGIPAA